MKASQTSVELLRSAAERRVMPVFNFTTPPPPSRPNPLQERKSTMNRMMNVIAAGRVLSAASALADRTVSSDYTLESERCVTLVFNLNIPLVVLHGQPIL